MRKCIGLPETKRLSAPEKSKTKAEPGRHACRAPLYWGYAAKKLTAAMPANTGMKKPAAAQWLTAGMERGTGVEPAYSAWEADALPMY